jgi:hypothetical protein
MVPLSAGCLAALPDCKTENPSAQGGRMDWPTVLQRQQPNVWTRHSPIKRVPFAGCQDNSRISDRQGHTDSEQAVPQHRQGD